MFEAENPAAEMTTPVDIAAAVADGALPAGSPCLK
eukprot:COSAG06_NODE_61830_length_266_cov_1.239521_1_plen_34_part_10